MLVLLVLLLLLLPVRVRVLMLIPLELIDRKSLPAEYAPRRAGRLRMTPAEGRGRRGRRIQEVEVEVEVGVRSRVVVVIVRGRSLIVPDPVNVGDLEVRVGHVPVNIRGQGSSSDLSLTGGRGGGRRNLCEPG